MKTKFELTPHLHRCIKKSLEAGRGVAEGKIYQGACATGRLSAQTQLEDGFKYSRTLLKLRVLPGTYDLLILSKEDLAAVYLTLDRCEPVEHGLPLHPRARVDAVQ